MLSSISYIRLRSVTNKEINDMLNPALFSVNPVCTHCQHESASVRADLNSWVLRTPLSVFEAIDSVTGCPEMGACHCIRFPFYGGMCLVKRVQEVRCCFYIQHNGERIINMPSIEGREFALLLK